METQTFLVRGMMCEACVRHVAAALREVEGVERADVALEPMQATLLYDPRIAPFQTLQAAVQEEGYELIDPRS